MNDTNPRTLKEEYLLQEDEQSQQPWKQRYRELLDEVESSQAEHREIARILRSSLSIITALGGDQHPELDEKIQFLESVKGEELDIPVISECLHDISDALFHLAKDPGHPNIGPNPFNTKLSEEFQTFLTNLAEQLSEIEQYLVGKGESSNAAVDSSENMNQAVKQQLSGISDSFDSCTDIEVLERAVRDRVQRIELSIVDHLREQDQIRQRSTAEVERVMDKLKDLESESNQLRTQLIDERAQAQIDPLTGVYNRKTLDQRVDQEVKRCARYERELSIAMWDLDSFKSINDKYGHQIGDKVLKTIGAILSKHSRKTDLVARYGGEEFVSLLTETPVETARQVVEKVRQTVEKCVFRYRDEKLSVTISCGLTRYQAKDTPESILARADAALYKAKQQGKNQVVIG